MWTNSLLKNNGKSNMKAYYWTGFGIVVIMFFMNYAVSYAANLIPAIFLPQVSESDLSFLEQELSYEELMRNMYALWEKFRPSYFAMLLISFVVMAFFTCVIECGHCRFYYVARNGDPDFGNLFWSFQGGRYMKTVKVMFQRYVEIMLWSFLLIIPGIVKYYEYMLVPYLMAENPNLSKQRAFDISKQTMQGEKLKCFWLQLSFIGWWILGALLFYIGAIFVVPYYMATMAEFYSCMRAKMLSYHITTQEELTYKGNDVPNSYDNIKYHQMNPYDMDLSQQRPAPHQEEQKKVDLEKKPPSDDEQ